MKMVEQLSRFNTELAHSCSFTNAIKLQMFNEETSDVTLIVEGQRLHVHKIILASRSTYFNALFYGRMKEAKESEIALNETPAKPFKLLLEFAYSSRIDLKSVKVDIIMEILQLSRRYAFDDLENGIYRYLKTIISTANICVIMDKVLMFQISALKDICINYADKHAEEVLKHDSFLTLSSITLNEILARNYFYAKEINIFHAVRKWIDFNKRKNSKDVLNHIRLPLISLVDLMEEILPSNLIPQTFLMAAIKAQVARKPKYSDMKYRGCFIEEENLATERYGARVVRGINPDCLLRLENDEVDSTRRDYTYHDIRDDVDGIVVDLKKPYLINCMHILLKNQKDSLCSYYVSVSMDMDKWFEVVNNRNTLCQAWQILPISPKFARYIRTVGTRINSDKTKFSIKRFKCMLTTMHTPGISKPRK